MQAGAVGVAEKPPAAPVELAYMLYHEAGPGGCDGPEQGARPLPPLRRAVARLARTSVQGPAAGGRAAAAGGEVDLGDRGHPFAGVDAD